MIARRMCFRIAGVACLAAPPSCNRTGHPGKSRHSPAGVSKGARIFACSKSMKLFLVATIATVFLQTATAADNNRAATVERLRADIEFFADDAQEGRGVDTKGIQRSAERIIAEFERLGLQQVLSDGGWRQDFRVGIGTTGLSEDSHVILKSSNGTLLELTPGSDCQPLRRGGSGTVTGGVVFVGYGVEAVDEEFDEYAGLDVAGKTLIVIRRVPGQGNPDAPFSGEEINSHAYIDTKLQVAARHKAAAVLFVNDPWSVADAAQDELATIDGFGTRGAPIPFIQIRQSVVDQLLEQQPLMTPTGTPLTTLRAAADWIDDEMQPLSQPLSDWSSDIHVAFSGKSVVASNLIGVVEGSGPLADETIVVGAHYDHIGFGDYGSRARNRRGEIHNGADDNASGTAALLELARRTADGPPPGRRTVFIAFSGEERGLLGSRHYVKEPVYPLDDTIFMLNLDMIGSVRKGRVEVNGVGTAAEFLPLVQQVDEVSDLQIQVVANPFGGSDHLPFYRKQIPVMFCFSGITTRYHTPDDDTEMINMDGVASVVDIAEGLLHAVDRLPGRPTFRRSSRGSVRMAVLGVRPDLSAPDNEDGVRIEGVREGSPAAAAAMQVGDVIVRINSTDIHSYADLNDFLRGSSAGDSVMMTLKRNGQLRLIQVRLAETSR